MEKNKYVKGVEKLIDPISVGALHFLQSFNEKISVQNQKKLMAKSAKENSLMGFVVEPYCYFLCYEITDLTRLSQELPSDFELVPVKVFETDEEAKYYFILGAFSARTSAFFGNRVEAYAIAKNKATNMVSWVILDYDTNTISYDAKHGLTKPSTNIGLITTTFNGEVVVDMERNDGSRKLNLTSNIRDGELKKLDPKLWIEGNLSVAYGTKLSEDADVFSLRFDPKEMEQALDIKLTDLDLIENTWYREMVAAEPEKLVCFPYAQHFLSDAPGYASQIETEEELKTSIEQVDFSKLKVYSTEGFKKMILLVPMVLTLIIVILVMLVIIT